jgi:predicted dienelactone hydrolase
MPRQRADVSAALSYLGERSDVDPARLALWGTSLGAMNVVRVAGARPDLAAAVIQCPIVHGAGAARSLGISGPLRLTPAIVEDVVRSVTRRGRRYVSIVGPPGSLAMVTAPGAQAGWNSTVPPDGRFDNRVTAPLLVCVCDKENLMNPRYAALVARRAPNGMARHYESDHFAIYHPPLVSRVLADQTTFFKEHLDVRT